MSKLFKTAMFGYKKKIVNEYIEDLSVRTENALNEAEDRIDELEKVNKQLRELVEKYKSEEEKVGNAIITAQKKAEEIISKAEADAEKCVKEAEDKHKETMADLENKSEEAKMKLRKINEEIRQLKTNIVLSANKYTKELDGLMED